VTELTVELNGRVKQCFSV